ncbi:hypothetical protein [Adonisia turfae]|uniref:Uncharacterized protein n=1 Tax=Adonisia turfae CCMR0081 TaxID=2292702 RepID=A0A6M0RU87_9CYAN|nr:hypothetical protein [Adonisia turfae]NEZ59794.1 hypothetical protein [Adonisia turfae CCMR0081]
MGKVSKGDTNTARGGATGTHKMRDEGEVHIKLLAKGKARITFPDEAPFILHYPNLEAYTQVTDSYLSEHDALIDELAEDDFESQIIKESPSIKLPTKWEVAKSKMQAVDSPLLPLMEWFESRNENSFSMQFIKENGKLRNTIGKHEYFQGSSAREKVESAVLLLVRDGLLHYDGEAVFNNNK